MLTSKPSKVAKVVICGMKNVGKTAILEQLIYGSVTPETVRMQTSNNHLPPELHLHIYIFTFCIRCASLHIRNSIRP